MSKRKVAWSDATRRGGRRPGLGGAALALLVLAWSGAPGDSRADTIVLKSGEVLEGSIVDATRNTVIVRPAIGGMRQMALRDIAEVRIDLAQGQSISGQLLSWADGIYQVRSGGQIVRVSEGDVLGHEPAQATGGEPGRDQPPRLGGPQTVRMAAAPAAPVPEETPAARPASARQQTAARGPDAQNQEPSAGEARSPAAAKARSPAEGRKQSPAAGQNQSAAVDVDQAPAPDEERTLAGVDDRNHATDEEQSRAEGEKQTPAAGQDQRQAVEAQRPIADADQTLAEGGDQGQAGEEKRSLAAAGGDQSQATDEAQALASKDQSRVTEEEQTVAAVAQDQGPDPSDRQSLAVKASVDRAEPGAESMVFKIELSRPAEQTVVLIYGTVEGTAKAGEDFEPQQGMVTLAPGTKSAEVRVPLIEQPPSPGEKRFELFLAADPKVAEVVDKRITATINGGN